MKKYLAILLITIIAISSFYFVKVNAGTYDDYRDVYWNIECKLKDAYKPKAGFRIVASDGRYVSSARQGSDDDALAHYPGETLEVRLGETVSILDESRPGSGTLDRYDFQVYCRSNSGKSVIGKDYSELPDSWVMNEEGIWDFYLCVRDNTPLKKGWTNWSDNGSWRDRRTLWWYFTHVRVKVIAPIPETAIPEVELFYPNEFGRNVTNNYNTPEFIKENDYVYAVGSKSKFPPTAKNKYYRWYYLPHGAVEWIILAEGKDLEVVKVPVYQDEIKDLKELRVRLQVWFD